jgi:membrane protease YdiL (CAAX protease family)
MINKIVLFFKKLNISYFKLLLFLLKIKIGILTLLILFTDILFTLFFSLVLFPNHTAGPIFKTKLEAFILAVIIAPIFETLIFQNWIINSVLKKVPKSFLFALFISSFLFGLSHWYSPEYVFVTFISGFLYGTLYLVAYKKIKYPFFPVAIAHSIFNLIGFCIDFFS